MQVVTNPAKMRPPRGYTVSKTRRGTLALALAAGLAAAGLAFLLVRGRLAVPPAPAPVSVVVAARDIPARTRLSQTWLRVRSVSPRSLPDGAFAGTNDLAGKVTTEPIVAGAAVTRLVVAAPSAALGMAFALPPSLRAVTVGLDPGDGADQFVRPGDHVDVLATGEPGSGPADARTVLQNVRLLAVGAQTSPDAAPPASSGTNGPAHVTVAVSPTQAQALVLAAARGKLHLSLRAADDEVITPLPITPAVRSTSPETRPATHRPHQTPTVRVQEPEEMLPLPPLPVSLPLAHVTITVIKGSQSQTVSVEP